MAARQKPTTVTKARAGVFTGDVDTEGMDSEMKKTLTTDEGDNPVQKFIRGLTKKKVAKPVAVKAKPAPKMSQSEEDALSKKFLGS